MESNGYKRFATTEAEIEEKRLKLNAERTIKQNKAAENGKILHTIILSRVSCVQCDILCKISELGYYVTYGYWMAMFRTFTSTQAVACYLKHL
jgi:hypothetical protein